jgi:hypothetical protein
VTDQAQHAGVTIAAWLSTKKKTNTNTNTNTNTKTTTRYFSDPQSLDPAAFNVYRTCTVCLWWVYTIDLGTTTVDFSKTGYQRAIHTKTCRRVGRNLHLPVVSIFISTPRIESVVR